MSKLKQHVWEPAVFSLVLDYPGEDLETVACADADAVLTALKERVSGEPRDLLGIRMELMEKGQWNDEGGCIKLYAHGVIA